MRHSAPPELTLMLIDEMKTETQRLGAPANAAFRIGVYIGVALSVVLTAWIIVANRVSFLEPFDRERNLAATTLIGLFALIPVLRYMSSPRSLLLSETGGLGDYSVLYNCSACFFRD